MSMSDYLETTLINHVLRGTSFSSPSSRYIALYTSDPMDANTGTEVTGGSYARQTCTFAAPTNGVTSNAAIVSFPVATADWGTVTHFGIVSALTGGNLWFSGTLSGPQAVGTDTQLQFLVGQLTVTLD